MPDHEDQHHHETHAYVHHRIELIGLDALFVEAIKAFQQVAHKLDRIEQKVDKIMAVSQQTADAIAKIDTETNALSDRVKAIQDKLASGSQTEEDKAAAVAELGLIADRLKGIGADPANPVPPAP